jgi:hypothetical protein
MQYIIFFLTSFALLFSKDIQYKIKSQNNTNKNLISVNGPNQDNSIQPLNTRNARNDTTTIWLQDFEGDLSDWVSEEGWEITEEESYSPSHSFHFDDDNYEIISSLTSPVLSVPTLQSENEILNLTLLFGQIFQMLKEMVTHT